MHLPRSCWELHKNYFTVKLVDNFKEKYIEFLRNDMVSEEDINQGLYDVIDDWLSDKYITIYQFPDENARENEEFDYFEEFDDNWVIPYELFIIPDESEYLAMAESRIYRRNRKTYKNWN